MNIDIHYSVNNLPWDVWTSWTGKYQFTKYSLVKGYPRMVWMETSSVEELAKEYRLFLSIAQNHNSSHLIPIYFPEVEIPF